MSNNLVPTIEYEQCGAVIKCVVTVIDRKLNQETLEVHHGYGENAWAALTDAMDHVMYQERPDVKIIDADEPGLYWLPNSPEDDISLADGDAWMLDPNLNQMTADPEL